MVQGEISAALLPLMHAQQLKFAASGREDKDVRMLGTGRAFVAQVSSHCELHTVRSGKTIAFGRKCCGFRGKWLLVLHTAACAV